MSLKHSAKKIYLPLFTFTSLILLLFTIWIQSIENHKQWVKTQVQLTGKHTSQEFLNIVRTDITSLENLKSRLETTNGLYYKHWEHDAEILLRQNSSFKFIEWIDSSMVIKKINPVKGNEAALNLDISTYTYRRDEWIKHTLDNSTNITPWANLTQGGSSFLVDVPVYFEDKFQGTITAGMDFKDHFNKFAASLENYSIEMKDEKGTIFYQYNDLEKDSINDDYLFESIFAVDILDKQNWHFKMQPLSSQLLMDKQSTINYYFMFGIILSFLISTLIYYYLKAKEGALKANFSNIELTKVNTKLNEERNRAEKASQAKTDFLSNMSHEIRTPLHAILGFIQVLKERKLEKGDKDYLEMMDKSSNNLLSIVNDILEIDKIESGEINLDEIRFKPSQEIKDFINLYGLNFKEKNTKLNIIFEEPYGAYVYGDKNKFIQIITNIAKNAFKFTPEGEINIIYREEVFNNRLKVTIYIKDTGIGISKDKIGSIFDRFIQVDSSTMKKHKGSGLGLAISLHLAKLLEGSISVESKENEGSIFTITTSFEIDKNQNKTEIKEIYKYDNLSHLKVLVVDDNSINILVLTKILEQIGIKPDEAVDGEIAVDMAIKNNYDLIMMDIHMPKMDGYEATRQIKQVYKDVTIFGLSANVTDSAVSKAKRAGMDDYITKPFTKERLYKLMSLYFKVPRF